MDWYRIFFKVYPWSGNISVLSTGSFQQPKLLLSGFNHMVKIVISKKVIIYFSCKQIFLFLLMTHDQSKLEIISQGQSG